MVAHLDAVTSLAIDGHGLYLISGSKFRRLTFISRLADFNKPAFSLAVIFNILIKEI
jgi:hypothetical protein